MVIEGIYRQNQNGDFGFVDVEGKEKGYYVYSFNKKDALDGDTVLAQIRVFKGKEEAIIIKILKRTEKTLVGEYCEGKDKKYGFVVLNDKSFKKDIFIPGRFSLNAKKNDLVGVKIVKWEGKNPEGQIINILGKKGEKNIELSGFILESGFDLKFSEEVLKEVDKINENISKKEIEKRVDLRKMFTFTIDGEDAKDLDDAISIKKKENGDFKLYVHIADVSNYVLENTVLDKNALNKGTSVYLSHKVIPMLPEKLSNNLCSLNPNTDKLALTCEMIIDKNGDLKKQTVYESIINSNFRLTYSFVDKIEDKNIDFFEELKLFNKQNFSGEDVKILLENLALSKELKVILSKNKYVKGVLNFDFPETKVILDEDLNPLEIKEYPRYNSNKIIEEFMIMANEAVSRKFAIYPFLYRVHEFPKDEDIGKLKDILNLFDIKFSFKNYTTKEFSDLLEKVDKIEEKGKKLFLEKTILRTLSKAKYLKENLGHFGLGLDYYSHFTSPIRRYSDLQIHRIIKEKLSLKLTQNRIIHYKQILENVAQICSEQEKKAEKLEYKVRDYFIVKYYKNKIGEVFESTIITLMPKGFFVQLNDSAEGFIELGFDFVFDKDLELFKSKKTGKIFRIGDVLKVKLIEADEILIRLNFEIV